jgi:hypothetical protein
MARLEAYSRRRSVRAFGARGQTQIGIQLGAGARVRLSGPSRALSHKVGGNVGNFGDHADVSAARECRESAFGNELGGMPAVTDRDNRVGFTVIQPCRGGDGPWIKNHGVL